MSEIVQIESLDQEGRGIAHADGKVIFIEGALIGDFGVCGGCSMQHLEPRAQVAAKQRVLEDNLAHIGKVKPAAILPAIHGEPWGYRFRARLSVRDVAKKGGILVGFHEKRSSFVADMQSCEVIPPRISVLLPLLRRLIEGLSVRQRLPQIELAIGDGVDALVLRILEPLSSADEALLRAFADQHRVQFFLQTKGPETAAPFYPSDKALLYYRLPEFDLKLGFLPTEFTQVNHAVNTVLVRRALALLEPQPGERVADLFCGLGNFSLAIARRGATVFGVEGDKRLVKRASENAAANGLAELTEFAAADLFKVTPADVANWGPFDRMLIDPPRDGAVELVKSLPDDGPRRIVYVSCNPATLARDAGVLVHERGYALSAAGIANMFPHTAHVESIAVFDRH
jgi:23S rRNA (uracil1939-C5)-methyltransferase